MDVSHIPQLLARHPPVTGNSLGAAPSTQPDVLGAYAQNYLANGSVEAAEWYAQASVGTADAGECHVIGANLTDGGVQKVHLG